MNAKSITSALIVAVVGFSLGLPGTTVAGDRKHNRHGYGHSGGHGYNRHNRHHYKGRRHYRPYYGHHGHRGYGGNYYYYDDDNYDELLFGLITGGIIGYALNENQQGQRYAYPPPPDTYSRGGGSCLQQREYQTTVFVGGREVDAYGTACLQPDGSWMRTPPSVIPTDVR